MIGRCEADGCHRRALEVVVIDGRPFALCLRCADDMTARPVRRDPTVGAIGWTALVAGTIAGLLALAVIVTVPEQWAGAAWLLFGIAAVVVGLGVAVLRGWHAGETLGEML